MDNNFNQNASETPANSMTGEQSWAPQQDVASEAQVPVEVPSQEVQAPAETVPDASYEVPQNQEVQPQVDETQNMAPVPAQGGNRNMMILIIVGVVLILGSLVVLSKFGYISLFGLEKLWGGGDGNTQIETNVPTAPTNPITPTQTKEQINDTQRKTDLANLKGALKTYYSINQKYPVSSGLEKTTDEKTALRGLLPNQIQTLPVDPLSPQYFYGYKSDGKTFELSAVLEDKNDSSGKMLGNNFLYLITDSSIETPITPSSTQNLPTSGQTSPNTSDGSNTPIVEPTTTDSSSSSSSSGQANTDYVNDLNVQLLR